MHETLAGVILAGGAGSRIGGTKGLQPFASACLVDAVVARVRDQVGPLALNVSSADLPAYRSHYEDAIPLITDSFPAGTGPLAGVVAGLAWVASIPRVQWLATFPCDTPFLPDDLVERLVSVHDTDRPVAAATGSGLHGVCAVWPVGCLAKLQEGIASGGLRSLASALEALQGTRSLFEDEDAFFNVNTIDDLKRAEAMARSLR